MADPNQTTGDLLAHIHGDGKPLTKEEIAASPSLAQDLAALEQIDALLHTVYGGAARPDPQDLVDVLMDQATPTQRLIVAAYVRDSVRGQHEMATLKEELAQETSMIAKQDATKTERRFFIAKPITAGVGLRSQTDYSEQQTFQVDELQSQVTLRIVPPTREIWEIEGYVTQNYQPIAEASVTLEVVQSELDQSEVEQSKVEQSSQTDREGFFSFHQLSAGQYSLMVQLEEGTIKIPELTLLDEDG